MISYIQKFNALDPEIKSKVTGEKAMAAMRALEDKYRVKLAAIVMRLMIGDLSILDLSKFLKFEYDLEIRQAEELVGELKDKVLWQAADHLGFSLDDATASDTIGGFKPAQAASASIKTSDFFFSPEDEDEVKELARKLQDIKPESETAKAENDKNIEAMAAAAKEKMRVNFSANELNDRFQSILKTYLKGVRSRIDSKQAMMKAVGSGGLDFNDDLASRALKIADEVRSDFLIGRPLVSESRAKAPSGISAGGLRDVPYDFARLKEKTAQNPEAGRESLGLKDVNRITHPDVPVPATLPPANQNFKIDLEALKKAESLSSASAKKADLLPPISAGKFSAPPKRRESDRPLVEDVKFVPRLTGPIDELREMSLGDFRRLGINSLEAANQILEKIDNLEKESYEKRLLGIQAWRESPVNRLYLELAETSIQKRRKVAELIAESRSQGKDCLKPEEFSAVLELNKKIRF